MSGFPARRLRSKRCDRSRYRETATSAARFQVALRSVRLPPDRRPTAASRAPAREPPRSRGVREDTAILSYASKFAAAFYGPFREAAGSSPQFGNRRGYQLDPANGRQAVEEARLDAAEGADMLMVKPALPYLDVITRVKSAEPGLPLVAYQVSGEYSMLKAAAANGWIDEPAAVDETLTAIKRAGADVIITYFAVDAARRLAYAHP